MLSLAQSCSWWLRWDENRAGGFWGWGETPDFAAEAEMAQGLFPGSDRHRPPGTAGLGVVRTTASPEGNSQGTVLVSAFLLLPEPSCHPGRAPALGVTSRAISEALVTPLAGRNIPREPRIKSPSSWGRETPGDSNLSIGRVKAIIFYLQRMAESLVVSGAQKNKKEKVAMA